MLSDAELGAAILEPWEISFQIPADAAEGDALPSKPRPWTPRPMPPRPRKPSRSPRLPIPNRLAHCFPPLSRIICNLRSSNILRNHRQSYPNRNFQEQQIHIRHFHLFPNSPTTFPHLPGFQNRKWIRRTDPEHPPRIHSVSVQEKAEDDQIALSAV